MVQRGEYFIFYRGMRGNRNIVMEGETQVFVRRIKEEK